MTKRSGDILSKAEEYRAAAKNRKRVAKDNIRRHGSFDHKSEVFGYGVGLKRIVSSTDRSFVKR